MHRTRTPQIAPLLFLSLLFVVSGCMSIRHGGTGPRHVNNSPLACHQIGLDYDIGVDPNNRVAYETACVDKKQKIHWKRVGSENGFRIHFVDPRTPIRPIDQECRNECRAEILPEAVIGDVWTYSVTDLKTGQTYDPVIIIDNCC